MKLQKCFGLCLKCIGGLSQVSRGQAAFYQRRSDFEYEKGRLKNHHYFNIFGYYRHGTQSTHGASRHQLAHTPIVGWAFLECQVITISLFFYVKRPNRQRRRKGQKVCLFVDLQRYVSNTILINQNIIKQFIPIKKQFGWSKINLDLLKDKAQS